MGLRVHCHPMQSGPLVPLIPFPPTGLTGYVVTGGTVYASWNPAIPAPGTAIASYNVYANGVLQLNTPSLNATITNLPNGVVYYITVTSVNNFGRESLQPPGFSASWPYWDTIPGLSATQGGGTVSIAAYKHDPDITRTLTVTNASLPTGFSVDTTGVITYSSSVAAGDVQPRSVLVE